MTRETSSGMMDGDVCYGEQSLYLQAMKRPFSHQSMTITNLFQIVTGCALFFACMRFSPVVAIVLTIFLTPAIIRTGLVGQRRRVQGHSFSMWSRTLAFGESLFIMLVTLLMGLAVFALISLGFGLICIGITAMSGSATDLLRDVGFIGTLGGTIWGSAGAVLSLNWTHKMWTIPDAIDPMDESPTPTT